MGKLRGVGVLKLLGKDMVWGCGRLSEADRRCSKQELGLQLGLETG